MADEPGFDPVDLETPDNPVELAALRQELHKRCQVAGLTHEETDDPEWGSSDRVHFPSGRTTRTVVLQDSSSIRQFLSLPFERFTFLGDYLAICSYADGTIEAAAATRTIQNAALVMQRVRRRRLDLTVEPEPLVLDGGVEGRIVLGACTEALDCLGGLVQGSRKRLSLRIEAVQISTHDQALDLLERVANSVFFQIDLTAEVVITLSRRRRPLRQPLRPSGRSAAVELEFPRTEYDKDPISLYWYARNATGMPLLQYLAFYQTIEFYFPTYSQAEARRKVRNVLKNPAFRPDRDADLAKILSATRATGQGYGDERAQLKATLNECLEPNGLREFLTATPERSSFFSSKTEGLTEQKISIRREDADLRNEVADRIYDIRCKIVHTKSGGRDGDVELLLPYSKEADLLYLDIELIQFVAREVLVAASSSFRL